MLIVVQGHFHQRRCPEYAKNFLVRNMIVRFACNPTFLPLNMSKWEIPPQKEKKIWFDMHTPPYKGDGEVRMLTPSLSLAKLMAIISRFLGVKILMKVDKQKKTALSGICQEVGTHRTMYMSNMFFWDYTASIIFWQEQNFI